MSWLRLTLRCRLDRFPSDAKAFFNQKQIIGPSSFVRHCEKNNCNWLWLNWIAIDPSRSWLAVEIGRSLGSCSWKTCNCNWPQVCRGGQLLSELIIYCIGASILLAEHHRMMKAENEMEEKDKQEMEKKLNRKWKIYYANLQTVSVRPNHSKTEL